jgi:tetratricopeptide (TPR) repeat protein
LYAPSFVVLTLAFIFTGLFVAASYQSGIISYRIVILDKNRITKLASTLLMLLLVLGLIYLGFIALNKTISAFYFKRAVDLSNAENTTLEMIEEKLNGAIKFAPADIHYTALSRINFAKAQRAVSDTDGSSEEDAAVFQLAISESISSAQQALNINPASYSNWLVLGSIYSALVPPPLSVSGSYEYALDAYSEAKKRNPIGPEIPLSLAWLELGRGEIDLARAHIEESLTLKPDYVDAYLLLVQIEISEDNTEEAVRYVENLIILVPDNASFHFGLGFLKYSNADYTGAAQAMFNAISLVPDYADAQYYYGLSLARLGRLSEALEQFELLYTTNPENEDVQIILNELRAGRSPI